MVDSLWGEEFAIQTPQKTKQLLNKLATPKTNTVEKKIKSKSVSIEDKLDLIKNNVYAILGKYEDDTLVIRTKEEFKAYIDTAIQNGVIAVDTETNNSLDPITCKIMGLCLYTPHMKNVYIPINHTDLNGVRLEDQLTEQDLAEELPRLNQIKIIMHNAKFDYEVIKCTCNVDLDFYWDTLIGVRILDENEKSAGLKQQYISKIDSSIEKYSIEHLFEGISYAIVSPELFALYAATDSFMTYKLYEYQKSQFDKPGNEKLVSLFHEIEMPVVKVAADMELTGVCIDTEYAKRLSAKYHRKLEDLNNVISKELHKYDDKIAAWRLTPEAQIRSVNASGKEGKSKSEQLQDPVVLTSPTQLSILLYDVLKIKTVDKKNPRGTGEDILNKIDIPLCKLILQQRGLLKLINTYIDKIPTCISSKDGRLHAKFNTIGADTGRFSSSDPNLQNIPSSEHSIRMMFTASPGCVLVGSDFSQQEPRLLASYSGDTNMITAYQEGKDLYATIAASVYHNNYDDNREFYPDGTMNPEGKKRRSNCKSLLLGLMYGRGVSSIADQIHGSIQEAQKITDDFFNSFPKVKDWINKTEEDAQINGYVEDLWGRRRRLPDLQLPQFSIEMKSSYSDFNPLLHTQGLYNNTTNKLKESYLDRLTKCRNRYDVDKIKQEALNEGIVIHDNGGYISQAKRQCVNARIQGGAASMSKRAMILVHNDEELRNLGFKLLIAVHDELIGECPIENKEEAKARLSYLMIQSAKPECEVPMKCDADDFSSWYLDVYEADLQQEYSELLSSGKSKEDVIALLIEEHSECTKDQLLSMIA